MFSLLVVRFIRIVADIQPAPLVDPPKSLPQTVYDLPFF